MAVWSITKINSTLIRWLLKNSEDFSNAPLCEWRLTNMSRGNIHCIGGWHMSGWLIFFIQLLGWNISLSPSLHFQRTKKIQNTYLKVANLLFFIGLLLICKVILLAAHPSQDTILTWRFGIHVSSSIKYERGQCSWDLGPWFGCFRSSNDHVCSMNKHHHHCNKSYVLHVWNLYLHVPGKVAKQLKNYTKHCDAPPPSNNGK